MDEGRGVDNVYLDFNKAFDTVSHEVLISKLRKYGFGGWTVGWIENCLNGKSQRVVISGTGSRCPPWFYTGPGIFNLFVNDLAEGADASSASLLITQGWKEWPVPQRAVQPFRRTSTRWRNRQRGTILPSNLMKIL